MDKNIIDIIGVPMDYGGNRRWVDMGPSAVRYSGLKDKITNMGFKYHDCGNISVPVPELNVPNDESCRFIGEINSVNQLLYRKVTTAHNNGSFPLIIGGDHSLSVGSVLASMDYYKNIGVIWIDAHADFNTATSSR